MGEHRKSRLTRKSQRPAICLGVALLVSACQTMSGGPDQPLDPQSLVGEWRGEHYAGWDRWPNVLVLTITRVDGDRVFGILETWRGETGFSMGYRHTRNFHGTLRGHDLTFGPSGAWQLKVYGRRMTGRAQVGSEGWDLDLTKR